MNVALILPDTQANHWSTGGWHGLCLKFSVATMLAERMCGFHAYPVPPDADDPMFAAFYTYWAGKCGVRRMPRRGDIDPLEIPDLLGHINIIKVHRAPAGLRFQYTLWGTFITELYGEDHTGRFLDEIALPFSTDDVAATFARTVERGEPHFWQVPLAGDNFRFTSNRRLLLPLSEDGETVSHMIALMIGDRR